MAVNWLKNLFKIERPTPSPPIAPGLYHARQEAEGTYTRFHLRVERDGTGMLIANARAAAQLSPTGVLITKGLLDGKDEGKILEKLQGQFRGATETRMREDIGKVNALINEITTPSDAYPVYNLEDAAVSPYDAQLIAPLQASLPLTEAETLVPILDRMWAVGIPHVTLLVPPQPEAADLTRAVERAEDLGMIAGVRGRATDLCSGALLADLWQAGLDHVTILYASTSPEIHDALCGAGDHAAAAELMTWLEDNQICAVAEVPLTRATLDTLNETIETLMKMGADNISFEAFVTTDARLAESDGIFTADAMPQVATIVEETAEQFNARFIWNPPMQRNPEMPLPMQVQAGPRCFGDVAVRIETDGTVIPARGPYEQAGNLLQDDWNDIWEHEVFRVYRERVQAPTRCDICPGLAICAADCPREPKGWAQPQ